MPILTAYQRGKLLFSVFCNFLIVILTAYGLSTFFTVGGSGNMAVMNTRCFVYFTVDSNVLAALSSLLLLFAELRYLRSGRSVPKAVAALKFIGTAAVTLTFFTVVCFLGFLYGFRSMFVGVNLWMHLVTPLLAMLSFCFLETSPTLRFRCVFSGLIPTLVYGFVYMLLVVALHRWPDFYGFNMGGRWFISSVLMLLATFLLSLGLWALQRAFARKGAREPVLR